MPDIGGLVFYVAALRLAERLVRLLALPPGHDERVGARVCRVAAALALCVFADDPASAAGTPSPRSASPRCWRRRSSRWRSHAARAFRWRETIMAASFGALAALALLSPMIVAWLADPAAHDYATVYAAYRKPNGVFAAELLDWCGSAVLFAAVARRLASVRAFARSPPAAPDDRRGGGRRRRISARPDALRPPPLSRRPGADRARRRAAALLVARRRVAALATLAALAAATLTPLAAWAPPDFAPTAGRPHPPRADLAELARLKAWVEARARPDNRVCGLGSSYTFSGQLIEELWQLDPVRSPFYADARERPSVTMSDVDTVDGPPNPELKTCAIMLVGDPVQTHLDPDDQQTIVVPAREMLAGEGIGAHYRRTGEVFHLDNGVDAVVFERTSPLDDADMAALAERWRAARARGAACAARSRPRRGRVPVRGRGRARSGPARRS